MTMNTAPYIAQPDMKRFVFLRFHDFIAHSFEYTSLLLEAIQWCDSDDIGGAFRRNVDESMAKERADRVDHLWSMTELFSTWRHHEAEFWKLAKQAGFPGTGRGDSDYETSGRNAMFGVLNFFAPHASRWGTIIRPSAHEVCYDAMVAVDDAWRSALGRLNDFDEGPKRHPLLAASLMRMHRDLFDYSDAGLSDALNDEYLTAAGAIYMLNEVAPFFRERTERTQRRQDAGDDATANGSDNGGSDRAASVNGHNGQNGQGDGAAASTSQTASRTAHGGDLESDPMAEIPSPELPPGEWLMPPLPLSVISSRVGLSVDKTKTLLNPYGLRKWGGRQSWTVRLDAMQPQLRTKLSTPTEEK